MRLYVFLMNLLRLMTHKKFNENRQQQRIFIGIDPGSKILGYAIVEEKGEEVKILNGSIILRGKGIERKMSGVYKFFSDTIDKFVSRGDSVYLCIEEQYVNKNVRSCLVIVRMASIFYLISGQFNIPIIGMQPSEARKKFFGYGACGKSEVARGLEEKLGVKFSNYDESDALLLALALQQFYS